MLILFIVKTWNGEKSFVDREAEQDKTNGVKRSFDDEYNEDFDRGVVSIFICISKYLNKDNHIYKLKYIIILIYRV